MKFYLYLCSGLLVSQLTLAHVSLKDHVLFLSSDALEGRLTGTTGEKLATQYVAKFFRELGLEPAGDHGTYFQSFDFTTGVSLGAGNSFLIKNQAGKEKKLRLNHEWRPLSFSQNLSFEHIKLVLVGYGITAPALGSIPAYDAYHGLNVKDKYVVVFRDIPDKISNEQRSHLSQYASLRYKAFTAKEHGAKGIIFVNAPNEKRQDTLIPLSFDTLLSGSDILAVSMKQHILNALLKNKSDQLEASGQIHLKRNKRHGRNVLAKLKLHEKASGEMLVVGAHGDHLGHGQLSGSREQEYQKKLIHNGADDNASGVSILMQSARDLSKLKFDGKLHGKKDILFAVWSGEEEGFLGSSYFIKEFIKKTSHMSLNSLVSLNINLDMVGRLRKGLLLQGVASSTIWPKLIERANKKHALPLILQENPYLPTDSTPFYVQGVPTLNFFTGAHAEYHTSHDKAETLNYEGMERISMFLVDLIQTIEDELNPIDYQHVAQSGNKIAKGRRVYLGTIPDYSTSDSDSSGVKIFSVTKNSPAEAAGIQKNDIIIELAGKEISNLFDYTFVLNSLYIGKPTLLVVRRGKKNISLFIVARSRI